MSGKLGPKTSPSKSPSPESEECGRIWGSAAKKKALKALVRWPPDLGPRSGSPKRGKSQKRLRRKASGKVEREGLRLGDRNVLQKWLQREKEGFEAPKTCLGPKKAKEPDF